MHKSNWDDYRYVLAVAASGSVSAAARSLGVNHATVLRRVASVEARLGVALFDKSMRGYEIAPEKLRLIEAAREVETAVDALERMARAGEAPLDGVLRVTSTDTFCNAVLPPVIARLTARSAGLSFELMSTNTHLDLSRLHADVTVRPTAKLPEDLTGDVVAHLGFGYYAVPSAPQGHWLGASGVIGRMSQSQDIHEALAKTSARIVAMADSFVTLRAMAEAGLGRVCLPRVLGDMSTVLTRVEGPLAIAAVPIYVATHIDLADVPRLRQARRKLGAALSEESARLLGD